MTTISLKLPEALLRDVAQEAAARRVGKSAVIRDCIEHTLRRRQNTEKKGNRSRTCLGETAVNCLRSEVWPEQ